MMIDAHVHIYDSTGIGYGVFERRDPTFEALVGGYSALPRSYTVADYRRAMGGAAGRWYRLARVHRRRPGRRDSLGPAACRCRRHAPGAGRSRRLRRPATRAAAGAARLAAECDGRSSASRLEPGRPGPADGAQAGLPDRPRLGAGLARLRGIDLRCGLEVFAPQLADLAAVVRRHPDIGFTIAVLGWPTELDAAAKARWRADLSALSRCDNTVASISAVECIFGLDWDEALVTDWISVVVELFGTDRCMFGSHLPIDGL